MECRVVIPGTSKFVGEKRKARGGRRRLKCSWLKARYVDGGSRFEVRTDADEEVSGRSIQRVGVSEWKEKRKDQIR